MPYYTIQKHLQEDLQRNKMLIKTFIKKSIFYRPLKFVLCKIREIKTNYILKCTLCNYAAIKGKKILLLLTPEYGNLGDHLIAVAATNFFREKLPEYKICEIPLDDITYSSEEILKKFSSDFDFVAITGGGFLGNLYLRVEVFFRMILKTFSSNKVVVLPQTIFFENNADGKREQKISAEEYKKHKNLSVFIRDSSFEFVKNNMLLSSQNVRNVPDIALFVNYSSLNEKRDGVLFCLRNDKEKSIDNEKVKTLLEIINRENLPIRYTDTVVNHMILKENRENAVFEKAKEFSSAKLVITDRLHGMIFAVITGTPCIALDNTTGKIKGVYNLWLKSVPYIIFVENIETITPELIKKLYELPKQIYSPEQFMDYWNEIKKSFL